MANTACDQASPQPTVTFGVRHIAFAKQEKKKKCKLRSLKKSVSAQCGPDGENSTEMTETTKKRQSTFSPSLWSRIEDRLPKAIKTTKSPWLMGEAWRSVLSGIYKLWNICKRLERNFLGCKEIPRMEHTFPHCMFWHEKKSYLPNLDEPSFRFLLFKLTLCSQWGNWTKVHTQKDICRLPGATPPFYAEGREAQRSEVMNTNHQSSERPGGHSNSGLQSQ